MSIKNEVYEILLNAKEPMSAEEIAATNPDWYRTYVSRVLSELVSENRLVAKKSGREVRYYVTDKALDETVTLKDLHEDEVWDNVRKNTEFLNQLSERAENILYFAFTEMLNNAIDHSKSGTARLSMERQNNLLRFTIRDYGIGVFNSVMTKKHLPDKLTAIQDLLKGKLTTMPRWHSGEGIFWTSKAADKFILNSYEYKLTIDNTIDSPAGDYTIEKNQKTIIGTEVIFEIDENTDKSLQKLFRDFTFDHNNLTLDVTVIPIKLYEGGDVWISRSQAKRVLAGLDRYKKIILDFNHINLIGQAFADEIFRVFRREHPDIILEPINMNENVALMVSRALHDPTGSDQAF